MLLLTIFNTIAAYYVSVGTLMATGIATVERTITIIN